MFTITFATENQSDPVTTVAVSNGATHLFAILMTTPGMLYVDMFDQGDRVRSWTRPKNNMESK